MHLGHVASEGKTLERRLLSFGDCLVHVGCQLVGDALDFFRRNQRSPRRILRDQHHRTCEFAIAVEYLEGRITWVQQGRIVVVKPLQRLAELVWRDAADERVGCVKKLLHRRRLLALAPKRGESTEDGHVNVKLTRREGDGACGLLTGTESGCGLADERWEAEADVRRGCLEALRKRDDAPLVVAGDGVGGFDLPFLEGNVRRGPLVFKVIAVLDRVIAT